MIDVVLPTLNELDALPWVLGRMPEDYRPIVVDNGSTDGSGDLAHALGAAVVREPQRGFGAACKRGLEIAATETVCFMDCDGSLDPRDLPDVADPVLRGESDLVLGARVPDQGAWPLHARLGNRVLTLHMRRQTGAGLRDLGPMRAGKRQALLELGIVDKRSGWPLEMVLRAIAAGWRVTEVPIPYHHRSGVSKVTGTVRGTLQAIGDMGRVLRSPDRVGNR